VTVSLKMWILKVFFRNLKFGLLSFFKVFFVTISNKKLSYRRETALQGAL